MVEQGTGMEGREEREEAVRDERVGVRQLATNAIYI